MHDCLLLEGGLKRSLGRIGFDVGVAVAWQVVASSALGGTCGTAPNAARRRVARGDETVSRARKRLVGDRRLVKVRQPPSGRRRDGTKFLRHDATGDGRPGPSDGSGGACGPYDATNASDAEKRSRLRPNGLHELDAAGPLQDRPMRHGARIARMRRRFPFGSRRLSNAGGPTLPSPFGPTIIATTVSDFRGRRPPRPAPGDRGRSGRLGGPDAVRSGTRERDSVLRGRLRA